MKGFFGKGKTRGDETPSPEDFKKGGMYIAGISAVIVVAILLAMNLLSIDVFRGVRGFVQGEGALCQEPKGSHITSHQLRLVRKFGRILRNTNDSWISSPMFARHGRFSTSLNPTSGRSLVIFKDLGFIPKMRVP